MILNGHSKCRDFVRKFQRRVELGTVGYRNTVTLILRNNQKGADHQVKGLMADLEEKKSPPRNG